MKAASSENLHADEWAEMPENPAAYTLEEAFGKYLLQEKNQVLYHYLQRESGSAPDSGPIGNGTEGRGSYCPHFGSKGGGAADRCCAGRI